MSNGEGVPHGFRCYWNPRLGAQPVLGVRTCTPAPPTRPLRLCGKLCSNGLLGYTLSPTPLTEMTPPTLVVHQKTPNFPRQTRISPMRDFLNFHLKLFKDMESSRNFPELAASRMERKGST